jgi:hypothetical protein
MVPRVLLLLIATALSLSCLVASSRADGPRALMLIDRGESDGGVRWAHRARANGDRVITEFTLRGADDVASSSFVDAHLSRRDPVAFSTDSALDPADEQLLEGASYSNVDHLRLELVDGTAQDIKPVPAPEGAMRKWHALRDFRFFVVVLPHEPAMARLVALDRRGKAIVRIPLP